jgi:hypothetical protein
MVEQTLFPPSLADKEQRLKSVQANNVVQLYWYKYIDEFVPIHCIKPYLRPMSSMTEEEKKEYRKVCELDTEILTNHPMNGEPFPALYNSQDWLDKNMFDYRGLIPLGLALEAPKDMYNF